MARIRTQKAVASRIDLNYHRRPHPWRRARVGLVLLCMLGAGAWFAFSSVRFKDGRPILIDSIHNPGPVARAHAQIEQDCKACHDGNGEKGYWLSVSDQACLACHDGSLHHMNQKLADSHTGLSKADLIMATKDDKHPGGGLSANCISCHIEHRGHDALAGTSDQHCITCHENVDRALQPGTRRESAVRVIAFNTADHPRFGRKLQPTGSESASADAAWVDSTRLRYNHKLHVEKIRKKGAPETLAADLATDCVACHSSFAPQLDRSPADPDKKPPPPYFTASDAPQGWYGSSDTRYIQPVSFDAHCVACHVQTALPVPPRGWVLGELTVKDLFREEFSVSHVDLSLVRSEVESNLRKFMDSKTEYNATKPGAPGAAGDAPAAGGPARRGPGGARPGAGSAAKPADVAVKLTEAEWLRVATAATARRANELLEENSKRYSARGLEGQKLPEPTEADTITPAVFADYYTAYIAVSSCIQCHDLEGNLPGLSGAKESIADRLRTVSTGIPKTPRRWFASSKFDHAAHRQMDCRSCHAPAWTSEATSDVLTSDIDGRYSGAASLTIAAAGESCVSCHHADTKSAKGAPANCVTCHEYHDHKFERSMDNPLISARQAALGAAPASQPAR